jgi:DNA-binding MarR family transcriptional regulator
LEREDVKKNTPRYSRLPDPARDEMVERTLKFAEEVTRELLPLTPRDTLMLEVTTSQLKVMFIIYLRGPLRVGTLARALAVSLPTMTVTVDRLVKRGLLVRENDPEDRRAVFCRLSDQGQQVLNQLWVSARERTRQMLTVLNIEELKVVQQALEILLKAGQITRDSEPAVGE